MKMQKLVLYLVFLTFPLILNAQWVQTNLNPGIGYCLFSNDTTIYAGTNTGVYYTNDIGDPWFSIGPEDWIFSVITSGNNIVAGSGSDKGIWITSDLGESWVHASGIDSQSVNALCKSENYLFAGTWGGGVFRSDNNGSSWQKVGLDGEPVQAVLSLAGTIFAGGEDIIGGKVYFSTNNGDTWDYRYLPYPAFSVYCFAYKAGKVFAGTDGGLYSSSDSGNSWSLEYGATFDDHGNVTDTKMFKALIAYDQYLIAAIMFESIWISSDEGKEWTSFNEGLISDWTFYGLAVKDPNLWSLTESFGNAYRRPLTDFITGIHSEVVTIPGEYVLYQNYPNPFNPKTIISYQLPMVNEVDLVIYNLVGQKIATLVSEKQEAGHNQVEWNATGFASGVYYYHLVAEDFKEVKKMILLR